MITTALTAADTAFAALLCTPAPLAFDGRAIDGLPERFIPLGELRDLLMAVPAGTDTADAVWRQLAAQVRDWNRPEWVIAAVGIAAPGLTRLASRLSRRCPELARDIDSEVLAGFLHSLRTIDLRPPRLWLRLCWAAWRAGHAARLTDDTLELPPDIPTGSRTPKMPYGHPDLILGRAVAAGILTAEQAELIGATRLGDVLIEQIAAEQGLSAPVVRMRRKRAERILVAAISQGSLSGTARTNRSRISRTGPTPRSTSASGPDQRARPHQPADRAMPVAS